MSETEQKVKDIIVEQLGVNPAEVTDAATFDGDLGADSLDIMELVLAFEEAFKDESGKSLEIPDDDGNNRKLDCNERYYAPSEITWLLKTLEMKDIEIWGCETGKFQKRKLTVSDFEMLVISEK